MKAVILTSGELAFVSDLDFPRVQKINWWKSGPYACRMVPGNRKKYQLLHVFIKGTKPGHEIDHRNRKGLDCRRSNLRWASHSSNIANQERRNKQNTTSQFKGVSWHKQRGKWRAYLRINYRQHSLGLFQSEIAAAKAYDRAALREFRQFAVTNFK